MTPFHCRLRVPRWLAPAAALLVLVSTQAQQAPATPDARALAKYDKNKNGRLDPDELAAQRADEAKAASAVEKVSDSGATKEEVVELSPFEVSAGDEKGYSAANSMAGTRLNSKLEDIAGSVSVVTKQQLLDTASLDINDIFLYEIGTEGIGQFTDLSNDGRGEYDNVAGNPTGANRMRGLSSANIAVGGFTASSTIPIDSYNIDAVEIARGPNSNLAGLSDAGGTVNLVQSRANVSRETTQLVSRFDNYGGQRFSIDLNRPLIRNKLALRVSALYNETGYVRKPSIDQTTRQQYALTFKPFKTTTINGSFENFHEFARRANSNTPKDTISLWRRNGRPTWDSATPAQGGSSYTVNGVKTFSTTLPAGIGGLGSSNARILQFIDDSQIQYLMRGTSTTNTIMGTNSSIQQWTQSSNEPVQGGGLFKVPGTNDKSIYDWTDVNLAASGFQVQQAKIFNVSLDQGLINTPRHRLDLNVAWRREDQSDYRRQFIGQLDGVGNTLEVDTNARLIDGRPNPFFGRPYIGGVNPQVMKKPVFSDSYRTQIAYQLDLRRESTILKWLGMHRLNGYGEYSSTVSNTGNLRYHDSVVDNPDFLGTGVTNPTPTTNLANSAGALFYPLYYFGKTPGGGVEYANKGPTTANGKFVASYMSATSTAWNLSDPVTINEIFFSAQSQQKKKVRTAGLSVQSFFLGDQIVTTYGKRHDRNYTVDAFGTNLDGKGFFDETNLLNFGTNKRWRFGDTSTKGVVVKPFRELAFLRDAESGNGLTRFFAQTFRGLNFHYSESASFKPADTAYDLFLKELPNPSGSSKEYGFSLNMFDNRFGVRVTHQETLQDNSRAATGVIATRALGIDFHPGGQNLTFNLYDAATNWQQLLHPEYSALQAQDAAATMIGYTPGYVASASGKTIADASDATSKGWELELQFNPSRFWTLKTTGNQQIAVDSNISSSIQDFIAQRLPVWTTIVIPTALQPNGQPLTNAGQLWWNVSQGSNGVPSSYYNGNVRNALLPLIANQGKKKPQTREYSFNVITSYQLAGLPGDHAWLKNASIGGAFRWSSRAAIGFLGAAPDPDGLIRNLDKNKPVYDKATGNLDINVSYRTKLFRNRVGTRFQLNVRNATESGRLQGVAVNPDGTFNAYRIIDPRQFIFTTTFDL